MNRHHSQNLRPASLKTTPKETLLAQRLKEAFERAKARKRRREAEEV